MLVSLSEIKAYLGISGSADDAFLNAQNEYISAVIEAYCGRIFNQGTYIQTYNAKDFHYVEKNLYTAQYPIISTTSILLDDENITTDVQAHLAYGMYERKDRRAFHFSENIVITYVAGFATIPVILKNVCLSLIEERYNKKNIGVSLNFGSDVQKVAIPGVLSVEFDYSMKSSDRDTAYGMVIGSYANMLDSFRSERVLLGNIYGVKEDVV